LDRRNDRNIGKRITNQGQSIKLMANNDLVKKKTIALDLDAYERLSKLAAQLRIDNPGGGFVSMGTAVGVLLDKYEEQRVKVASAESYEINETK